MYCTQHCTAHNLVLHTTLSFTQPCTAHKLVLHTTLYYYYNVVLDTTFTARHSTLQRRLKEARGDGSTDNARESESKKQEASASTDDGDDGCGLQGQTAHMRFLATQDSKALIEGSVFLTNDCSSNSSSTRPACSAPARTQADSETCHRREGRCDNDDRER